MKRLIFTFTLIFAILGANAQKLVTKSGVIDIFSKTQLFTIEAKNASVASILNIENGDLVASCLVRSFKFKEALVEEHFNENYMESHLYPKATFIGKIVNFSSVDLGKPGNYPIEISGKLTIHGKTSDLLTKGELQVEKNKIIGKTTFSVSLQEYGIKIEESYKDRIKDDVRLDVVLDFNR